MSSVRECYKCKLQLPMDSFYFNKSKDDYENSCKVCFIQKSTRNQRPYLLMKNYNLTVEQYNTMFSEQEGKCKICMRHQSEFKKSLAVDHCHRSGKVRGLLCSGCNKALGLLKDNIEMIERAANYLKDNS